MCFERVPGKANVVPGALFRRIATEQNHQQPKQGWKKVLTRPNQVAK